MCADLPRRIAEAYRWHRRLGAPAFAAPFCRVLADPTRPDVWDCNHCDDVTAVAPDEIDAVFAAMDAHLPFTPWRVVHTDGFTPDPFLARLAFDDYRERFVAIQMARDAAAPLTGRPVALRAVDDDESWGALERLARLNHEEGHVTGGLALPPSFTAQVVASYRATAPACRFHLVVEDGEAVAYGALAATPGGLGMIEDIFTHPAHRRRGLASGLIADFAQRLRAQGCDAIFLGALIDEQAKRLYARLGFRPVALARCWTKSVP